MIQQESQRVQQPQRVQEPQRVQKQQGVQKNSKELINTTASVKGGKNEVMRDDFKRLKNLRSSVCD